MTRVLVAGGAGFIGSNLCERLLAEGYRVLCIDNLVTGRVANIEHLAGRSDFEFQQRDITSDLGGIHAVDQVYHLASPASPPAYLRYPIETLMANSQGTHRLLDVARRCGARFLFASTSEVYGDPIDHPQREDSRAATNPVGPRAMYHEAKRFGEALVSTVAREHGTDARIVRIFNTYGPRSDPDDGRLVPNFVCQALGGEPLTVYGDGSQTRSLCFVDDLVEGLFRVIEHPEAGGQVINLGNPEERTVLDYARLVLDLTGTHAGVRHVKPVTEEDPRRRRPDIGRAQALLGWEPRVPLEDGLRATIGYFRRGQVRDRGPVKALAGA